MRRVEKADIRGASATGREDWRRQLIQGGSGKEDFEREAGRGKEMEGTFLHDFARCSSAKLLSLVSSADVRSPSSPSLRANTATTPQTLSLRPQHLSLALTRPHQRLQQQQLPPTLSPARYPLPSLPHLLAFPLLTSPPLAFVFSLSCLFALNFITSAHHLTLAGRPSAPDQSRRCSETLKLPLRSTGGLAHSQSRCCCCGSASRASIGDGDRNSS